MSAAILMMFATSSSRHDRVQQPGRIVLCDVRGKAFAGHPTDARADQLNSHHEREGEERRPQNRIADACPDLRIGGDAARIVIGGAGDQARTQASPEWFAAGAGRFVHAGILAAEGIGCDSRADGLCTVHAQVRLHLLITALTLVS